jgi:hypothetical protein
MRWVPFLAPRGFLGAAAGYPCPARTAAHGIGAEPNESARSVAPTDWNGAARRAGMVKAEPGAGRILTGPIRIGNIVQPQTSR